MLSSISNEIIKKKKENFRHVVPRSSLIYITFPSLMMLLLSLFADLVLKDKIVVYDLAHQRLGWANYDCKCTL